MGERARYWQHVEESDYRVLDVVDRHYSRKTVGAKLFGQPGHRIVLIVPAEDGRALAVWMSHRPDPRSGATRMDGRVAWDCSLFRNEGAGVPASDLIREAVAITWTCWGDDPPRDGFVTFVDPRKVAPIRRRGRDVWGYCYLKAGWRLEPTPTKNRGLVVLTLPLVELAQSPETVAPGNTLLFGGATDWRPRAPQDRATEAAD